MEEPKYNNCFACGDDNPIGLKLKFTYEGNIAKSNYRVQKRYEGYTNIVHGGIVATLLDEAMAKIILFKGMVAVTGEMNVKYRRALEVDTDVTLVGEIVQEKSRTLKTVGKILCDGKIIAEATATYVKVKK